MEKFEEKILIEIGNGTVRAEVRNLDGGVGELAHYNCGDIRDIEAVVKNAVERVMAAYKKHKAAIKVGDIVRIINNGKAYTTHHAWFEKNAPDLAVYYSFNKKPQNGVCGVVKRLVEEGDRTLYAVEVMDGTCGENSLYLVSNYGIQKVR